MTLQTVTSSLKMRLDMAIDHLLSEGQYDLAIRLTQSDEDELCQLAIDDLDAGLPGASEILQHDKYRGIPRSITDSRTSYIEYGERLFGRGQRVFIERGIQTK